ncbi:MAG: radical SAM protein [Bacteroidales bacterium]|nr:radical SAM protein [Bacteroidales bacterium]
MMQPIKQIYCIITDSCNAKCDFCIRQNLSKQHNLMRLSSVKTILAELRRVYCNASLIITGGEPTLHSNFVEIVDYASKMFKNVIINTNGSFNDSIASYLQSALQQNVIMQMSLDGTKSVHNQLRNTDLFDCVINNLNKLQQNSKHIALSTTVNRTNYDNIVELAKLLNNYKFSHWKVSWEQVCNPMRDDDISYKEWNSLVDKIIDVARFRVYAGKLFDFELWDKYIDTIKTEQLLSNCGYGYAKFYVDTDFNVLTCSCTDEKIGNLLTDTIETIDNRLKEKAITEIPETSVCFSCRYRKICNSGCPGYSIKVFGKTGMGDYRCPIVASQMNKKC